MPVLLRESGGLCRRQGASSDRTFPQNRGGEHPVGLIFSSLDIRHVDNKVSFFLNLDQGTMSNEQVVRMLAGIGYEAFDYFDTTLKKYLARAAELFYSDCQSLAEQYGSRD